MGFELLPPEFESLPADGEARRLWLKAFAGLTAGVALPLAAEERSRARFVLDRKTRFFRLDSNSLPLGRKVNAYIQQQRRLGRIKPDETTSWSVFDFTTNRKLVSINEDKPLQAASMIKPFVAMAWFYEMERKGSRLRYGPKTRRLMEAMIRRSNNWATNQVMKQVINSAGGGGPRRVEQVLKRNSPGIFANTSIVELIPAGGRTYRNKASAHDYSRFLYALWKGGLPQSDELRELMSLPNRNRITTGAKGIPRNAMVYDKTGSTARLCGNMGIIEAMGKDGKRYPYTIVAIIEKRERTRHYGRWVATRGNVIRGVSSLVYEDLKRRHNLV